MHTALHNTSMANATADASLWAVPVAAVCARESVEAAIIAFTLLALALKAKTPVVQRTGKTVLLSIAGAIVLGIVTITAIAAPLYYLNEPIHTHGFQAIELTEGISKLISAILMFRISVEVPKILGMGPFANFKTGAISRCEISTNIVLNVWREVCEIGLFLLPAFLGDQSRVLLREIPLSALAGVAIGTAIGALVYAAIRMLKSTRVVAFVTIVITGWLACGLFHGAVTEFESALGGIRVNGTLLPNNTFPTEDIFFMPGCADVLAKNCTTWDPNEWMSLLVPFGYSPSPSLAELASFWAVVLVLVVTHTLSLCCAWRRVAKSKAIAPAAKAKAPKKKATKKAMSGSTPPAGASPNDSEQGELISAPPPAPADNTASPLPSPPGSGSRLSPLKILSKGSAASVMPRPQKV